MRKRASSTRGGAFLKLKETGFAFMLAGFLFETCSCSSHKEKSENKTVHKTADVNKAENLPARTFTDTAVYSIINQNNISKSSCISWSQSGDLLASGSSLGTVTVFNKLRDEVTSVLRLPFNYLFEEDGSRREVLDISWNGTEDMMAVSYDGFFSVIWDLKKDSIVHVYKKAHFLHFIGKGSSVVYIEQKNESVDSVLVVKDIRQEDAIIEHAMESPITALGKSIEGDRFYCLRYDGKVDIWDSKYYKRIKIVTVPEGINEIIGYSEQNQMMVVKNSDYKIKLLDVDSGSLRPPFKGDNILASCMVQNGSNIFVAYSATDDHVGYALYNIKDGKEIRNFPKALDSEIKLLACGAKTSDVGLENTHNSIILFDSYHNKVLKKFSSTDREINSFIFRKGRIITGSSLPGDGLYPRGKLQIWNANDVPFTANAASSKSFEYRITSMDSSEDGRQLLVRAGTFAQDFYFENGVMKEKPLESGGPYVFAIELGGNAQYIVTRSKYGFNEPILEVHDVEKTKRLFAMPASGAVDVLKKGFICDQKKRFVSYYREASGNQKVIIVDHKTQKHWEKKVDKITQGVDYLRWNPDCEKLLLSNKWGETLVIAVGRESDDLYIAPQDPWKKSGESVLYLRSDMEIAELNIETQRISEVKQNQVPEKHIWYQDRKVVMDVSGKYLIYGSENGYIITRMKDKKNLYVDITADGEKEHVLVYDDDGNYTGDSTRESYVKMKIIRSHRDKNLMEIKSLPIEKQVKSIVRDFVNNDASKGQGEKEAGHPASQLK